MRLAWLVANAQSYAVKHIPCSEYLLCVLDNSWLPLLVILQLSVHIYFVAALPISSLPHSLFSRLTFNTALITS